MSKKKWLIDGQALTIRPSGITNYLIIFLNQISQNPNITFIVYLDQELHPDVLNRLNKNTNIKFIIKNKNLIPRFFWRNFILPFKLYHYDADLFWGPAGILPFMMIFLRYRFQILLTVHDFAYKLYKHTLSWKNRIQYGLISDLSIKKAKFHWVVSQYTASKLLEYFPNINKPFVGSTIDFYHFNQSRVIKSKIFDRVDNLYPMNYVLFVGNLEPRKNVEFLIQLLPVFRKYKLKLCVVGIKSWGNHAYANDDYNNDVIFPGYISNDDLVLLYRHAFFYISTSLNEGFGMPLLEAMACSCPVICSHNSAMIEIVDNVGITVKSYNYNDWDNSINELIKNREFYVQRGKSHIEKFKIDLIVNKLFDFLKY